MHWRIYRSRFFGLFALLKNLSFVQIIVYSATYAHYLWWQILVDFKYTILCLLRLLLPLSSVWPLTFSSTQSGPDERSIPGNTIAVHAEMPFTGLTTFGGAFLSKFECSQMPHPVSYDLLSSHMHALVNIIYNYLTIQLYLFLAAWTYYFCGHSWGFIWGEATDTT